MTILNYKNFGNGEKKLIFLHELMGDCTNYENCLNYFDKYLFTIFMVDLRGYGLSKNILGKFNLDEAVKDVINLVTNLKLTEYILIAHSMSSMIAQHITSKDKRVKKLILLTPISYKGVKSTQKAKDNLLAQMEKNSGKIEEIVEQSSKRYNQTWKNYRINLAYNCSILEAKIAYMSMYLNIDYENNFEKIEIDVPIKIITGKYDFPVFSKNEVEKYFQEFKDVEIIEFEEGGHYPMIECPVLFASKIEFWANNL